MATSQSTIDFLLDQLSGVSGISARKMFSGYCLYFAGKPIGLVCNDQLFLKPTQAAKQMIENVLEGAPFPGAKPHLLITADQWEDSEWFCELVRVTARGLPLPKLRKPKSSKPVLHKSKP